jgi:hypothetical protein
MNLGATTNMVGSLSKNQEAYLLLNTIYIVVSCLEYTKESIFLIGSKRKNCLSKVESGSPETIAKDLSATPNLEGQQPVDPILRHFGES